eukprot:TRINITY_DN58368_c0_g1_i1.p1 TRINITY_DN58368_c0_g1~~TRINITY_DN58368_c0_g1_i1.p1  ORF type:complete len:229 (+),score=42.38 TRINITY_DN58368_c0_g1_i1:73-759(+)
MKAFMHDEFKQLGTDYNSVAEVSVYDQRMRKFRDIDAENRKTAALAKLTSDSRVLEIGAGTGAFTRFAAANCRYVKAVDISKVMLEYAAAQADKEGLSNISFERSGFLTFQYEPGYFDAVISSLALHHLSDLWKSVALRRICDSLRPGGRLVLIDVVFDLRDGEPEAYFEKLLDYAPGSRDEFARHIAEELSTCDWIMTGLLERAGFRILSDECINDFLHFYACEKQS